MKDFMEFLVVITVSTCVVILLIVTPAVVIDSYNCKSYGEVTGVQTQYAGAACYTKHEELGWLSSSEWNKVRVAERLLLEIKEDK